MTAPWLGRWTFGGPLADASAEAAWMILAIVAGFCLVSAWVSYRCSVARLGLVPSALLMLLRTALLLALLYCLANPVRVERHTLKPPEAATSATPAPSPRLAVVIDRSDSMTLPDNRGRSRLDDALTNWRRLEKAAHTFFGPTRYYSFAEDLQPADTLELALARTGGTSETKLYQSVAALLKKSEDERPDAVVVLTDGVDTSSDSEALLRDAAVSAGVPLYFVAGNNRSARPDPFVRVREWRVPSTAASNSEFSLEASFEAFSRADRTVPFSLWRAGNRIARGELALTTGANLVTRNFSVNAGEPGPLEFVLRIGQGDDAPLAARAVTEVRPLRAKTMSVLIYQGALDWGFRALADALRTDTSFEFLSLFQAEVGLGFARSGPAGTPRLGRLPEKPETLALLDCVVLAHPFPSRFSAGQQQALVDYVREGGTVLFVSPDGEAMAQLEESRLQHIMPVTVERPRAAIQTSGKQLEPFSLTDAGRASPIFARAQGGRGGVLLPRFIEYVPVSRAKPGAEILAIHPRAADGTGRPHILLASQQFGRGRGVLLATDSLWRWKLGEPAGSHVVETFWQQLLLAIGRRPEADNLHFATLPTQLPVGRTVQLQLGGLASDKPPLVIAKAPNGQIISLVVRLTADKETPWSAEWTPAEAGSWEIVGGIVGARRTSIFPLVVKEVSGELARAAPAIQTLQALAGETGGMLLTQEVPESWKPIVAKKEREAQAVVSERQYPLWNNWTVLGITLGIYAAELVLRRRWKLL